MNNMHEKLLRSFPDVDDFVSGLEQYGFASPFDSGLAHSLVSADSNRIEQAQLLEEATNQGLSAFHPEIMFEQMVSHYDFAEQVYGERLLCLLSGEDPSALKKNLRFPEFRRLLSVRMQQKFDSLKKDGFVDKDLAFTSQGYDIAALSMYIDELHVLEAKGLGERVHKKKCHYGEKRDVRAYHAGDRYANIALRKSVHLALRRGHTRLDFSDLQVFEREDRGKVCVMLALDASGSMKGKKISACKRAGIALAYKAIDARDRVGLLVFGKDISVAISPTSDFGLFLRNIVRVKAKEQTDFVQTIRRALELFPSSPMTKHLILITDAVPTVGADPQQDTLRVVAEAVHQGVTVSVLALGLAQEHETFARHLAEIGGGRLGIITDLERLDSLILEEYAQL